MGLLDRLAAGAVAQQTDGIDHTKLRPLLPYHSAPSAAMSGEDTSLHDTTTPSSEPPIREPLPARLNLAIDASRETDAPIAPLTRDIATARHPPAAEKAMAVEPRHIAAERRPAYADDASPSVLPRRPSPERALPGSNTANTRPQPQRTAEPPAQMMDISTHRRGFSVPDSSVAIRPDREPQNAPAKHGPPPLPQPTRATLSGRDAPSVSSVSPLPRPAPLRAEPTIEIRIGRIEVRAQTAAGSPAPPLPRDIAPAPSALAAHLAARRRGARS